MTHNTPSQIAFDFNPAEEWRVIPSFSQYLVSSLGQVKRHIRSPNGRLVGVMSPYLTYGGYYSVALYYERKSVRRYVHRLVAEAFLGPCPDGKVVNHQDGNRLNNYVTTQENCQHSVRIGLLRKHRLTVGEIKQIKQLFSDGKNHHDIAIQFDISPTHAFNVGSGRFQYHILKDWIDG